MFHQFTWALVKIIVLQASCAHTATRQFAPLMQEARRILTRFR
jgi:hypothetical protein